MTISVIAGGDAYDDASLLSPGVGKTPRKRRA
jgi:hypothetical protein